MRRVFAAFITAAIVFVIVAHGPAAWAHASLLTAEPADGAVVAQPPASLRLTFNEPVSPLAIRLVEPHGRAIAPIAVTATDSSVEIVIPQLQAGTHVLSWRVVSADGHPVGGSLIFSIGAPSAQAPIISPPGNPLVRIALWAAKLVIYLGLFMGIGGAFFRAWIAVFETPAAKSFVSAALIAGLLATPLSIGLQGLDALDLPPRDIMRAAVWGAGIDTAYGLTAIAAAAALVAGLIASAIPSPRAARALPLIALVGIGFALALSGHASNAAPRFVSRPAVFLHAVCVAFWVGSLLPLIATLRATPPDDAPLARFSRVVPFPLGLLVLSGLWLVFVQLGHVDALWTTDYGRVLAAKLIAVAALFGLAAANRYWLVPRFIARDAGAARALHISIAIEFAIVILIFALVALWRFTPPPRSLAAAATVSVSLHLHGEKAMAQVEMARERAGLAHADVQVLDLSFGPLTVKQVTLVLANPAAGIEPIRRQASRVADSVTWRIDDLRIPVAGSWRVRVDILISDFEKVTLEDTATLPRLP